MDKRSAKIRVRQHEHERVVLTEVLPYELPPWLDNSGFYRRMKEKREQGGKEDVWFSLLSAHRLGRTRPLRFFVSKNSEENRELWVIHPFVQQSLISVYRDYHAVMLHACAKSDWSLRRPQSVGTYWRERGLSGRRTRVRDRGPTRNETAATADSQHASTYFAYGPYVLLRQFEESPEMHALEAQYRILHRLDVARCFPSIYTHSIEWAIKGREVAKRALGRRVESVETKLDDIMRKANDGETAGIPVGPEFSRIFAEIILQAVDREVAERLEDRAELSGRFAIRRWVDDYFVFAATEEIAQEVSETIAEELWRYNLSVNHLKTSKSIRPFVNMRAFVAGEVCREIEREFAVKLDLDYERGGEESSPAARKGTRRRRFQVRVRSADQVILELKRRVSRWDADYETISAVSLKRLRRTLRKDYRLIRQLGVLSPAEQDLLATLLVECVRVAGFLFNVSQRPRESYLLCDLGLLVVELSQLLKGPAVERVQLVVKDVFRGALSLLDPAAARMGQAQATLLAALATLPVRVRLSRNELLELGCLPSPSSATYFSCVGALWYFGDEVEFAADRAQIVEIVTDKVAALGKDWVGCAEWFMAVHDILACPFIGLQDKKRLSRAAVTPFGAKAENIGKQASQFLASVKDGDWFASWSRDGMREMLRRKDLRTPY